MQEMELVARSIELEDEQPQDNFRLKGKKGVVH